MKTKTFLIFVIPSLVMMLVFIAVPLGISIIQSFQNTQNVQIKKEQNKCDPFGCKKVISTVSLLDDNGKPVSKTEWVGWENYKALLEPVKVSKAFSEEGGGFSELLGIDFYKAFRFTITFTLLTLPLVIIVGLILALAVNSIHRKYRGPIIFITLLPFVITPVIGALSIKWLFIGDGILTATIEAMTNSDIAVFSNPWAVEALVLFFRVWHTAPFVFVILYAGLQTLNFDSLEAAIIDGASRWERLRYIIVPHIMPLIVFVSLIHLMDAYRVFDEIIGFGAEAHVMSLQWLTFDFLMPDDTGNRSIGRASASAMLTMVGIIILLIPVLRRTWKEQR